MNPFLKDFNFDLANIDDLILTRCFKYSNNQQMLLKRELQFEGFMYFIKSILFSKNVMVAKLKPAGLEALKFLAQNYRFNDGNNPFGIENSSVIYKEQMFLILIRLVCESGLDNVPVLEIIAAFFNYPSKIFTFITTNIPILMRYYNIPADFKVREFLISELERTYLVLKVQLVLITFFMASLLIFGYFSVNKFDWQIMIAIHTSLWSIIFIAMLIAVKDFKIGNPNPLTQIEAAAEVAEVIAAEVEDEDEEIFVDELE